MAMLFGNEMPFPDNPSCRNCFSRPCKRLFSGRVYPGKFIFVHNRDFVTLPCYTPVVKADNGEEGVEAALTDDIVVVTGKVTVTNPRWKHSDEIRRNESPDKTRLGDRITLLLDVTGIAEGAQVTFDVYDASRTPPQRIATVRGKNTGGTAKAEWIVDDPLGSGRNAAIEFEGVARSKSSERAPVEVVPTPALWFNIDLDNPYTDDDRIILRACDGSSEQVIHLKDMHEAKEDMVLLVFSEAREGVTYDIIYDPGAEGEPVVFESGVEYDFLMGE